MTAATNARRSAAFTLAEYMVALSIGLMALAAAVVLWAYASKTCAALLNYVDLSIVSKNALDRIGAEVRNARSVKLFSASQLVLYRPDGTTISYVYHPVGQTLTQSKGVEVKTLLTGCSSFQFKVYQRTPQFGTSDLTVTTDTNLAKVVQMQWTCSRSLTGDKQTIESQVSAKVVIRSQ